MNIRINRNFIGYSKICYKENVTALKIIPPLISHLSFFHDLLTKRS